MPSESRTIIFSRQEVIDALLTYARARKMKIPAGVVRGLEVTGDVEFIVSLDIFDDREGRTNSLVFTFDEAGAAMIHYCIAIKIPLPRDGVKSLQYQSGAISLHMTRDVMREHIVG